MCFIFRYVTALFLWSKFVMSMSPNKNIHFMDTSVGDIADYIASKGYIPNENELPRASLIKNKENDATYILSKLSDDDLLKLLNEQPKRNEYDLNEIMKIAFDTKSGQDTKPYKHIQNQNPYIVGDSSTERKRFRTVSNNEPPAYFKLNHKEVDPFKGKSDANYKVLQKLKKLLNVYPAQTENYNNSNDDKKQLIFDILVAQLKTLCCKRPRAYDSYKSQHEPLPYFQNNNLNILNRIASSIDINDYKQNNEYMFLIINDELKINGSDELIAVDPESLDGNSSVLLLGPVTSPLTDEQLKLVMSRISNELTKPEYLSLLQHLSNGVLIDNNNNFIKNYVFRHETRRYIKPHRCNHQSKLAKVYGGPKWIVCTGYLNINKPSLYD